MKTKADLLPVFTGTFKNQEVIQLCNARDLHEFLNVGRDFATWVKDRIKQYKFIEGEDYLLTKSGEQVPHQGGVREVEKIDYHLTVDMAKELSMIENNAKGREVRRYFIAVEKKTRYFVQQPLPDDKKAVKEAWALFYSAVKENKRAGMDDISAWTIAGTATKDATGADLLAHMGNPQLGREAAMLLARPEDLEQPPGAKQMQGKMLSTAQRMTLNLAIAEVKKAAPAKYPMHFMISNWLAEFMDESCEERIPQHRFVEALSILRMKAECERES